MAQFLVALIAVSLLTLALAMPRAALWLWVLALATSPDYWLNGLTGDPEATAGFIKAYGLVVLASAALRGGLRTDRWNPSFAFLFMFCMGVLHGLHPGLSLSASLRSLLGSTAPFLFGFLRQGPHWRRDVVNAIMLAPFFAVALAALLALSGIDQFYTLQQGALRLGGNSQPPFLGGFALTGLYAALLELAERPSPRVTGLAAGNFLIILLTGARSPLVLGGLAIFALLVMQKRLLPLAAAGAMVALAVLASGPLGFLRAVDLTKLGEAVNLSHRLLVWPHFIEAIRQSPWVGWGVGAGKVIIPVSSQLNQLLGTNAAHDEYLRIGSEGGFLGLALLVCLMALWATHGSRLMPRRQRWLTRLIFLAFAIQSITDNTLIATTGSAFFLWASAIFANAKNGSTPATCSPAAPVSPFPSPSPPPRPPWPAHHPWRSS
ncbi:O-antigen ligase family protein [Acidocella sp.]|uniref:O-antigen ligase family protein n=1 Tax=Acidocella sp. TaxID=50710 RepID=UPI003D027612